MTALMSTYLSLRFMPEQISLMEMEEVLVANIVCPGESWGRINLE